LWVQSPSMPPILWQDTISQVNSNLQLPLAKTIVFLYSFRCYNKIRWNFTANTFVLPGVDEDPESVFPKTEEANNPSSAQLSVAKWGSEAGKVVVLEKVKKFGFPTLQIIK